MNALEWQAKLTMNAAVSLSHWLETTRPDRIDWVPSTDESTGTRSALTLVHECTSANTRIAAALRGEEVKPGAGAPAATAAEASRALMESASAVADALRGLREDVLEKTFELGRGAMPGSVVVALPATHMIYHGGQINLIQLLYGDKEFRVPQRAKG